MPDIKTKLKSHLRPDDKRERCGFITKRGRIIEVPNTADKPEQAFRIDPAKTLEWVDRGVIATWHTHPHSTPNLSGEDYDCFVVWDKLVHYIVGRVNGEVVVREYVVKDGLVVRE